MKNILIIYTSSGLGHKKIAEHIGEVLKSEHNVELVDLFDVEKGNLVSGGTNLYLWIIKHIPGLWNFFYTNKIFLGATLPFRRLVAGFKSGRIEKILAEKHYDVVITTQVNASAIVSYLKLHGKFAGKFVVTFSDFHLHRYWLFGNVDLYLANITEQKEQMIALGISAEKIIVAGITVPPATVFGGSIREEFGLQPGEKLVLLLGGGKGLGIDEDLIAQIAKLQAKVFVVCGQNKILQERLENNFASNERVKIFGFIDCLPKLYSIADAVVGKPGGLTVAEVLSYSVPMFLVNAIAGQETLNQDYLVSHKLVWGGTPGQLTPALANEIKTGHLKELLVNNPQRLQLVGTGEQIKKAISAL